MKDDLLEKDIRGTSLGEDSASRDYCVSTLTLTDFRNYDYVALSLEQGPLVLTGPNGAGKTNLLEAVSFLIPGRGLRRAKLSEIDRAGGGPWAVTALVECSGETVSIGTGRDVEVADGGSEKRVVKIDGDVMRGQSGLAQFFSAVWLTPQMDQIFMEGNVSRRRFLDRLAYGFDAQHAACINKYEYIMSERNRLLVSGKSEHAWFEALERKMAEAATAIAAVRLDTVGRINASMKACLPEFPRAEARIQGSAEDALMSGKSALEVEDLLVAALADCRIMDGTRGRTSVGAHKSEFIVHHAEKGMEASRCSTGEQKALLLSLIMAQASASKKWHGRLPVLLLDEVIAHLDDSRRGALAEAILSMGCQAWMTGTDTKFFEGLKGNAQFIAVEEGAVKTRL